MTEIAERVEQLVRRYDRLSSRPLDPELLVALDELAARLSYYQRLERLHALPRRAARIPTDAAGIFARIVRSFREEHPEVVIELARPSGLRRALLDAPGVELAARCWLELLHYGAPGARRIALELSVGEEGLSIEVLVKMDSKIDLERCAIEVEIVREGLARASLEWIAGSVHRLRSREPEPPVRGRYVFPPPDGSSW